MRLKRKTRHLILLAVTFGLAAVLAACDMDNKYTEPWNDAPRKGAVITEPVEIIANADGFSNMSTGCNHGNRWYAAYHADNAYAALAVVAQDPSCKGKP